MHNSKGACNDLIRWFTKGTSLKYEEKDKNIYTYFEKMKIIFYL